MNERQQFVKKILGNKLYNACVDINDIVMTNRMLYQDDYFLKFTVKDKIYYWITSRVDIINDFNGNIEYRCNCTNYYRSGVCEHIGACLLKYYDKIINVSKNEIIKELSSNILDDIAKSSNRLIGINNKQELKLEVELRDNNEVVLRVGIDKLYAAKNKIISMLESYYKTKEPIEFGKNFIFDPSCQYFNEEDEKILSLFYDKYNSSHNNYITNSDIRNFNDNNTKHLINLVKNKGFFIKDVGFIKKFSNEFPFSSKIAKENDDYIFNMEIDDVNKPLALTSDFEYILYHGCCYHLNTNEANIINSLLTGNLTTLIFPKKYLSKFASGLLPMVKEKIEVDPSADDIVIVKKPDCKLYFDLNYNDVICNIKLEYNDIEIDYFDSNSKILRDLDYENGVLSDLYEAGFRIDKKAIILDDLEIIGDFLDSKLKKLSDKYETYTTQRLKEISIVKNTNVTSTFSIGKDNIMKFDFDLGDITAKELDNIFSNLKKKKKYYKLKSGDILNLEENEEILQLEELTKELELTNKEIGKGSGTIPKYRALYLDSLKNTRYNIIRTDGLFTNFIKKFKDYKNSDVEFTKEENDTLRDYQKNGVKWLYNIHKCDFGCILADEMGLGKSLQVIYFIRKLLVEDKDSKFLIVVPTSLVYNWKNEILKFAPELKYEIFSGLKEKRHELFDKTSANIYITSYGLLREDFENYENINFKVCVIDEAQNIKNPNAGITRKVKQIKADTKIALTGTPIENSVIELWSIFDYIMPGFLSGVLAFQSKYNIKEFDDKSNKKLELLNKQISPFILRRRKKDVLLELPDKIENNIFIDLSEPQKKLYAKEVERVKIELERITREEGWTKARFLFLQLIMKLRQICIDPQIVYDNYDDGSNKIDSIVSVVKEQVANGHKILIFTSFRTALNIVKNELIKNNITCYTIDGSVDSKKRMQLVDDFNKNNTNVFLIMLKAGGTGLNLTSADVVIHLDIWWNPQAENQATDRAHRIGQKNTVEVIKLISSGTIEERILELQEKKKILSDKLIEGDNRDENIISKLSEEDVKYLLSSEQETNK